MKESHTVVRKDVFVYAVSLVLVAVKQIMAVKALAATSAGASLHGSDDSTINGPTYPDATAGRLLELFLG